MMAVPMMLVLMLLRKVLLGLVPVVAKATAQYLDDSRNNGHVSQVLARFLELDKKVGRMAETQNRIDKVEAPEPAHQ
jgi:hypothetical protein